jgi:hypothetical protein
MNLHLISISFVSLPSFIQTKNIIMAKQTLEQQMMALLEKAKKANTPKPAPAAALAAPRVKGKDVAKAVSMMQKAQKMMADALAILNAEDEKSDDYLANEAMFPEVEGAFFGRKANGEPKAPSGKQATIANKEAFAKAYPSLVKGFQLQPTGKTKKVPMANKPK